MFDEVDDYYFMITPMVFEKHYFLFKSSINLGFIVIETITIFIIPTKYFIYSNFKKYFFVSPFNLDLNFSFNHL